MGWNYSQLAFLTGHHRHPGDRQERIGISSKGGHRSCRMTRAHKSRCSTARHHSNKRRQLEDGRGETATASAAGLVTAAAERGRTTATAAAGVANAAAA